MRIGSVVAALAFASAFFAASVGSAPSASAVPQIREAHFLFHACQSDYSSPDNSGPGNKCTFLSPGGLFYGAGPYTISWKANKKARRTIYRFHCGDSQPCGDVKNVPKGAVVTMSADGPAAFVHQICITDCLST
jgi:hypothetical protein